MRKIVETILPTTMVGSYPRPGWFDYQLLGAGLADRDVSPAAQDPHDESPDGRVVINDEDRALHALIVPARHPSRG
jgi:hypothetical protein